MLKRLPALLPDGTQITMRIGDTRLETIVFGLSETAVEVAEQLSWLGSALRPSPYERGLALCKPFIVVDPGKTTDTEVTRASQTTQTSGISFLITFGFTALDKTSSEPGYCWSTMFRNTVIVHGFPIPHRASPDLGLEASIDVLAKMMIANSVEDFDERLYIKGFSSMLVATNMRDGLMSWHHAYNSEGGRISFSDVHDGPFTKCSFSDIESARHIVGWSPKIKYNGGESHLPVYPHSY